MNGGDKYDTLCTDARVAAEAQAAILIILGGNLGSGFCVQIADPELRLPPTELARLLRTVAETIENDTVDLSTMKE